MVPLKDNYPWHEVGISSTPSFTLPTHIVLGLLAIGLGIAVFITYIPTIAPSISWRNGGADSGDLASAIAVWGIPHPPGYPTYVLLGRAWSALPLGGDLAYRLNLLSATSVAMAISASAYTIGLVGRRLGLAGLPLLLGVALGSLSLALAPLVWSQATVTEVYGPGLALLSFSSLALVGWQANSRRSRLILAGLISGLSLGVLPQLGAAAPGTLVLLLTGQARPLAWPAWRRQVLGPFLVAAGLGLLTFAYLPVRALAQPWLNWGDPSSPARLWDMITVAPYQQYATLLGPGEWLERLGQSITLVGQQLNWAAFSLAILGGYILWRGERPLSFYLAGLTGLTLLFRTSYPVAGNVVYLLPVLYCLALLAGLGAAWLLSLTRQHIGIVAVAGLGLGLLVTFGLRTRTIAARLDASADQSAVLFGQRVMASLPPDALVVSERDETTFSLWYQQALGQRRDVAVVDQRLLSYDWYQRQLTRRYPDLAEVVYRPDRLATAGRPVYVAVWPPGVELVRPVNTGAP